MTQAIEDVNGRADPSHRYASHLAGTRAARLVAADAAFDTRNEAAAKAKGVKRASIPNRSTKSLERKREQKKRWFRNR